MFLDVFHGLLQTFVHRTFSVSEDTVGNFTRIEDVCCEATHCLVLGFVCLTARATSPTDQQNHGNRVDFRVIDGGERVDAIAKAGVLHVDNGDFGGGEVVASGETNCVTFVGGDDVVFDAEVRFGFVFTVPSDAAAEFLQEGVGDTEVGCETCGGESGEELVGARFA